MNSNKIFKFLIKLLVSAGLLAWIFYSTDWNDFFAHLKKVDLFFVFLYIFIYFLGIGISSYKWQFLANHREIKKPFGRFFELYLAGTFINNFMPSFIGGDTYKAYQIGKKENKITAAVSTVAIDRITGFLAAGILAVSFGLLNFKVISQSKILLFLDYSIAFGLLSLFLITKIKNWQKLKNLINKKVPEKALNLIKEFYSYSRDNKVFILAIVWGMVFSLVGVALCNFALFLAFGLKINLVDYFSVIFLISIISSVPISINNIGIKEWAYVSFFGFLGINPQGALAVVITSRFLQIIISFGGLPVYFKDKK